jgi:sulfite exporter TauE/SafE
MEIFSAFVIGLLGSLHCVGMCGPVALALPVGAASGFKFYAGRILYNTGRVITYSVIGLIFGIAGKGLVIAGVQQGASIALGAVIIISFVIPRSRKVKVAGSPVISRFTLPLRSSIGKLFKQRTLTSFFLIGLLNGLLPCGFVYIGVAGAVASGSPLNGALFMALFGLGTTPAMFAAALSGKFISLNIRRKLSRAVPVFVLLMAAIFILRGLNLGIPYLSPAINSMKAVSVQHEADCCR